MTTKTRVLPKNFKSDLESHAKTPNRKVAGKYAETKNQTFTSLVKNT